LTCLVKYRPQVRKCLGSFFGSMEDHWALAIGELGCGNQNSMYKNVHVQKHTCANVYMEEKRI